MADLKDCSLQFPDLKPVDHVRNCPKYTHILNRHEDEGIMMEELDSLQMELERLLASASSRMRVLKSEIKVIADLNENKKDKKVSRGKDADGKRSRLFDDRPMKKMKMSESPAFHGPQPLKPPGSHLNSSTSSPGGAGRSKAKGSSHSKPIEPEIEEQPIAPRSAEVPNKFWQMVDTYCGPITQETITLLEKMEKPLSEEYYEIPPLGKHFSQIWAEEDLATEEKEGSRFNEAGDAKTSVEKVMKKTMENLENSEPCPFGSLTQRLVSAFVQENIMAPLDVGPGGDGGKPFEPLMNNDPANSPKSGKASSAPHTTKLEARIKAELIEQGRRIIECFRMEHLKLDLSPPNCFLIFILCILDHLLPDCLIRSSFSSLPPKSSYASWLDSSFPRFFNSCLILLSSLFNVSLLQCFISTSSSFVRLLDSHSILLLSRAS